MRGRIPDDGRRVRDVRCKSAFTERTDEGSAFGQGTEEGTAVMSGGIEVAATFFGKIQKCLGEGGKMGMFGH